MRQFKLNSTKLEFSFSNEKRLSSESIFKRITFFNNENFNIQTSKPTNKNLNTPNEVLLKFNNLRINSKLKLYIISIFKYIKQMHNMIQVESNKMANLDIKTKFKFYNMLIK